MTAQWQARNATRILELLKNFWLCVYLFFHGRIFWTLVKYVKLTWHDGNYWSRCPIWVQIIIQSQRHLQIVFLWFLCILRVVLPVLVTTSIISCFVWWQPLTVGNRDNQIYSSLTGKKQFYTSAPFFTALTQWYLNNTHLLLQRRQTLHKHLTRITTQKNRSWSLPHNKNDSRRSDPNICSFNKFLSKKRHGYQAGDVKICMLVFSTLPRCNLGDVSPPLFSRKFRKVAFLVGHWFLGTFQFFFQITCEGWRKIGRRLLRWVKSAEDFWWKDFRQTSGIRWKIFQIALQIPWTWWLDGEPTPRQYGPIFLRLYPIAASWNVPEQVYYHILGSQVYEASSVPEDHSKKAFVCHFSFIDTFERYF